jgi:hypothetical protein
MLGFVNDGRSMGDIGGSYDPATGVLTLGSARGTATLQQWQAALRAVSFLNTSEDPSDAVRAVTITLADGQRALASATRAVAVVPVNDRPVLATSPTSVVLVQGAQPQAIDPGLTVTDVDSEALTRATVSILGRADAQDAALLFTNVAATMGDIDGDFDRAAGVVSAAGATAEQWQAALRSVSFAPGAGRGGVWTVEFRVTDESLVSDPGIRTLQLTVVTPPMDPMPGRPVDPVPAPPPAPAAVDPTPAPAPAADPTPEKGTKDPLSVRAQDSGDQPLSEPEPEPEGAPEDLVLTNPFASPAGSAGSTPLFETLILHDGSVRFGGAAPEPPRTPVHARTSFTETAVAEPLSNSVVAPSATVQREASAGSTARRAAAASEDQSSTERGQEPDGPAITTTGSLKLAAGAFSLGAAAGLWRVAGLAASALASRPIWHDMDPIPLLPDHDDDSKAPGVPDQDDPDALQEEAAAAHLLDENRAAMESGR